MLLHGVDLIGNMLGRNSSINIDQLTVLGIVVLQRSGEGVVGHQTSGQGLLCKKKKKKKKKRGVRRGTVK